MLQAALHGGSRYVDSPLAGHIPITIINVEQNYHDTIIIVISLSTSST